MQSVKVDTSNATTINLNNFNLTTDAAFVAGIDITAQGPGTGVGTLVLTNTGGTPNSVSTTTVNVGYNGPTQGVGPQNQAKLSITDAEVDLIPSGNIFVGGRIGGELELQNGNIVATSGDLYIGGAGGSSATVGTNGELTVNNIAIKRNEGHPSKLSN